MSDVNAIPQWFSGSEHTHRVAAAIAQYGPIARTTLAQMLGLSQGALSRITSDLIYAGVIEELPAEAGPSGKLPERFTPRESSDRRGRPQTSLVLCSNARTFIGVKVHGMSIVAAAVNAHGEVAGAILWFIKSPFVCVRLSPLGRCRGRCVCRSRGSPWRRRSDPQGRRCPPPGLCWCTATSRGGGWGICRGNRRARGRRR